MHAWPLLAISALSVALSAGSAAAQQWQEHMFRELGIAKDFPAPPRLATGTYETPVVGRAVPATIYSVTADNIIYSLTIADLQQPEFVAKSASIYAECLERAEAEGRVLARMPQRVEDGTEFRVYGQLTSVDLANNGGRKLTNCFYTKGRLYKVEATVLPAHGEYNSSLAIRFAVSLRFRLDRAFE
jgi:hypothetical protein